MKRAPDVRVGISGWRYAPWRGAYLAIERDRPLCYALEVRHPSYDDPAFVRRLRKHDVALCVADTAGRFPYLEAVTSSLVYVGLHGDKELYVSGCGRAALDRWAQKAVEATRGVEEPRATWDRWKFDETRRTA